MLQALSVPLDFDCARFCALSFKIPNFRKRSITRAASRGDHPAQVNLGIMYWNGLAVPPTSQELLYQTKATDRGTLAIPLLTIFVAAVIATLSPVIRALQIDPVLVLARRMRNGV